MPARQRGGGGPAGAAPCPMPHNYIMPQVLSWLSLCGSHSRLMPAWFPGLQWEMEKGMRRSGKRKELVHPCHLLALQFTLSEFKGSWEDSNPQFISEAALPQNDLCCNGTGQTVAVCTGAGSDALCHAVGMPPDMHIAHWTASACGCWGRHNLPSSRSEPQVNCSSLTLCSPIPCLALPTPRISCSSVAATSRSSRCRYLGRAGPGQAVGWPKTRSGSVKVCSCRGCLFPLRTSWCRAALQPLDSNS